MTALDSRELRSTLGQFATGVTIVTAHTTVGGAVGMTVNSFASLSLDPPLITWAVGHHSPSCPLFLAADAFAVNVLGADQRALSQRFAAPVPDRFAGLATAVGLGGVPLIPGCIAWLECRTEHLLPGGDHTLIVGRVERISRSEGEPLLFWRGDYRSLAPL